MKSKQAMLRVLLDTSFILPSLGIDTGEEILKGLKKLIDIEAEIHYSRFSILESIWVAARLIKSKTFDIGSFMLGLRSILESGRYKEVDENYETFNEALNLYMLGHKDMIDNILYANSVHLNLKLLTLDNELKDFIRNKGLKDNIISSDQIT